VSVRPPRVTEVHSCEARGASEPQTVVARLWHVVLE